MRWAKKTSSIGAAKRMPKATQVELGGIVAELIRKDIKNLRLSVHPPAGVVRISAPRHMAFDTIRVFALSKIDWIIKQQKKIAEHVREAPREYLGRESHYLWGKCYLLKVVEKESVPSVSVSHSDLVLQVRPGADRTRRAVVLNEWYRQLLRKELHELVTRWEAKIGVRSSRIVIQRMKTKWGSCNTRTGSIRFNLELAKKPLECLEYVVVHELLHLIEPSHNGRFKSLMSQYLPRWKCCQEELNRMPVGHEDWNY